LSYCRNTLFVGLETAINLRKRSSSKIEGKSSRKYKEDKNKPKTHNLIGSGASCISIRCLFK